MIKIKNRWPLSVEIFQPRQGGGLFVSYDKMAMRKNRENNRYQYRLKKNKFYLDPQRYSNVIQSEKGPLIKLWNPAHGVYEPLTREKNIDGFKISANEIAWKENYMNQVERIFLVFNRKSFFEQYGGVIMLLIFGFMLMMSLAVVRSDITSILDSINKAAGSVVSAATTTPLPGI